MNSKEVMKVYSKLIRDIINDDYCGYNEYIQMYDMYSFYLNRAVFRLDLKKKYLLSKIDDEYDEFNEKYHKKCLYLYEALEHIYGDKLIIKLKHDFAEDMKYLEFMLKER